MFDSIDNLNCCKLVNVPCVNVSLSILLLNIILFYTGCRLRLNVIILIFDKEYGLPMFAVLIYYRLFVSQVACKYIIRIRLLG